MTDFLKIAKSIVVHFAHICAYGVETVKWRVAFKVLKVGKVKLIRTYKNQDIRL